MSPSDWLALGVPCLTIALGIYATYAGPLGAFLAARTHNERLGRIVSAAGRYAAEIADVLATLPPGANVDVIKKQLLSAAGSKLGGEFAQSAALIGATDPKLVGIVAGELAKIPPRFAAGAIATLGELAAPEPAPPAPSPQPPATPIPVAMIGATS